MQKAIALLSYLALAAPAGAQVIEYYGIDPGVGIGGPRPNSDAAAAGFDSAARGLGVVHSIDFEALSLGNFGTRNIGPDVDATLTGTDPLGGIVADGWFPADPPQRVGYNTTAGGDQFLGLVPASGVGTASVRFDFATPTQAFGAYLTGLGTANGNLFVEFDDGSLQSLPVSGHPDGGVLFHGFTDAGASIVSVTLELRGVVNSRDIFGIDDLRWAAIPEPASGLLLLLVGGLFACRRLW